MKTKIFISILFVSIIIFPLIMSCNPAKTAVACPDISLKKNDYKAHKKVKKHNVVLAYKYHYKKKKVKRSVKSNTNERMAVVTESTISRPSGISKIEFNNSLVASSVNTFHPVIPNKLTTFQIPLNSDENEIITQETGCDTIFLKNGGILIGKVDEIGQNELKYRKCNNLTGPVISVQRSGVSKIIYSNGTSDLFGPSDTPIQNYSPDPANLYQSITEPPKPEGLGIAGFISGALGLFVASIPLGIVATVFGGVSLSKINRNPMKFRGRGLATASIILGVVDIVVMIVLMAVVL